MCHCTLHAGLCVCLCSASDNIPKADEIRTLVKDIWDTRVAKLRLSADSFISQMEAHAKVTLMDKSHTLSIWFPQGVKEYRRADSRSYINSKLNKAFNYVAYLTM